VKYIKSYLILIFAINYLKILRFYTFNNINCKLGLYIYDFSMIRRF
jgi:hypothetical protein